MQRIKCLAQENNTLPLVSLEQATPVTSIEITDIQNSIRLQANAIGFNDCFVAMTELSLQDWKVHS